MTIDSALQQQFEQCVDQCADSLFRVAFRLTGNRTLANELVQETYLNAWKSISSLSDSSRIRSWMFSILRNQHTKLLRVEKKATATNEHLDKIASITSNHESNNETVDRVQDAIARLDENHKLPMLLVSMEGLSVDEAATALGIPRGTVLSRLHRGRAKLKSILSADNQPTEQARKEESNGK